MTRFCEYAMCKLRNEKHEHSDGTKIAKGGVLYNAPSSDTKTKQELLREALAVMNEMQNSLSKMRTDWDGGSFWDIDFSKPLSKPGEGLAQTAERLTEQRVADIKKQGPLPVEKAGFGECRDICQGLVAEFHRLEQADVVALSDPDMKQIEEKLGRIREHLRTMRDDGKMRKRAKLTTPEEWTRRELEKPEGQRMGLPRPWESEERKRKRLEAEKMA